MQPATTDYKKQTYHINVSDVTLMYPTVFHGFHSVHNISEGIQFALKKPTFPTHTEIYKTISGLLRAISIPVLLTYDALYREAFGWLGDQQYKTLKHKLRQIKYNEENIWNF